MTIRILLVMVGLATGTNAQKHTAGYTWKLEECTGTTKTREVVCKIDVSSQKSTRHGFDVYRNHRVMFDVGRGAPIPSSANWIERGKGEPEAKIVSRPRENFYYFVKFDNVPVVRLGRITFPRSEFNAPIDWQ